MRSARHSLSVRMVLGFLCLMLILPQAAFAATVRNDLIRVDRKSTRLNSSH